ncbi:hypothetical protein J437_LFUL017716, partial [Ladona fulva]
MTDFHKAARLDFARQYVNENVAFWRRVVFSDEKTFSSSFNGPVTVFYRPNNTRFHPHYVMQRGRSGQFSINTWGWVCAEGPGALWKIEGNLDGTQYVSILENVMLPSVKILFSEDFVFLHDNSRIHTCKQAKTWFSENNVLQLTWPARSPDLNPIENIWGCMVHIHCVTINYGKQL